MKIENDYIYKPRYDLRKNNFIVPIITPEKAEIMGCLAGDGCVRNWYSEFWYKRRDRKNKYYLRRQRKLEMSFTNKNLKIMEEFLINFIITYGIIPYFHKGKFEVITRNRSVTEDLIRFGSFDCYNWFIPKIVISSKDKDIKIKWLRGYFDTDGTVGDSDIDVDSVNYKGLKQVKTLLNQLNIYSKIYGPYKDKRSRLSIRGKNIIKFASIVNFNHPIKKERLNKLVCKIKVN